MRTQCATDVQRFMCRVHNRNTQIIIIYAFAFAQKQPHLFEHFIFATFSRTEKSLSHSIKVKLFLMAWNRTINLWGIEKNGGQIETENKRHANANEVTANDQNQHEIMQQCLSHIDVGLKFILDSQFDTSSTNAAKEADPSIN